MGYISEGFKSQKFVFLSYQRICHLLETPLEDSQSSYLQLQSEHPLLRIPPSSDKPADRNPITYLQADWDV